MIGVTGILLTSIWWVTGILLTSMFIGWISTDYGYTILYSAYDRNKVYLAGYWNF